MMGKTHTACGIASALTVMQPDTLKGVAAAVALGALGGAISDIDLYSRKNRSIFIGNVVTGIIIISGILLAADFIFRIGLLKTLIVHTGIRQIVGFAAFLVLSVISMAADHRDFSHSLFAMALFTLCVFLMFPESSRFFAAGFMSHILLDLTNKKPVRLLFPVKKGICFKWFYAAKTANHVFFIAGCIISVIAAVICIIRII